MVWGWAPPPPVQPVGGLCDMGVHPAATLLVPYFEVDPGGGLDTVVTVTNTADRPVVARVVIWNVDGWAVAGFNLWLWKFDQAEFSLRWLLEAGHFPNNGCPTDAARFRVDYADCDGDGRYMDNAWTQDDGLFSSSGSNWDVACYAPVPPDVLANWQCKLSVGSYDGWSENYRGYVTIDATLSCSGGMQDAGTLYFATDYLDTDGDGIKDHGLLENSNVLMGDILYLDRAQERGDAVPAVHIEAWGEGNALEGHTWGLTPARLEEQGISTFWNKYEIGVVPPNDAQESLPLWWAFRYIDNESFQGGLGWMSGVPTMPSSIIGMCKTVHANGVGRLDRPIRCCTILLMEPWAFPFHR